MAKGDHDDNSVYPHYNGLADESLEDYAYDVETLVQGTKKDDRVLWGPRELRRLGGIPGALARQELKPSDLANEDGYKLILVFLEKKGYKKDSLDRRLLAQRRYDSLARRPG